MIHHWIVLCAASVGLAACTDSTSPQSRSDDPPILSLPEYAAQLRGDPFLRSVSGMLGRPQLADAIDASLGSVASFRQSDASVSRLSVSSARLDIAVALGADTVNTVTEADVLAAALTVTLDRIAQVSGDSTADATAENPPPSR
jgi:hypothetical protein